MNSAAIAKIRMIKASRRCLAFGLLGFIPGVGLIFALLALWLSGNLRLREKQFWNPAKPYRILGAICAGITAVLWGGIFLIIFGNIIWFAWFQH